MMSSRFAPASRFSKIADTGIRVPFNTHAPLTLPGTLSTAGHCDQSRVAIEKTPAESITLYKSENKAETRMPQKGKGQSDVSDCLYLRRLEAVSARSLRARAFCRT